MFIEKQCILRIFEGDKYVRCDWKISKSRVWETGVFLFIASFYLYKTFQAVTINFKSSMDNDENIRHLIHTFLVPAFYVCCIYMDLQSCERKLHGIFKNICKNGINCPFSCPWVTFGVLCPIQVRRCAGECLPKTEAFLLKWWVAILYFYL